MPWKCQQDDTVRHQATRNSYPNEIGGDAAHVHADVDIEDNIPQQEPDVVNGLVRPQMKDLQD